MMTQILCLALVMYHEARGEPTRGEMQVGHVVMARVKDKRYPDNVCDVVFQDSQFEFVEVLNDYTPYDRRSWRKSYALAKLIYNGVVVDNINANHYHNMTIKPEWTNEMEMVLAYNEHVFYRY